MNSQQSINLAAFRDPLPNKRRRIPGKTTAVFIAVAFLLMFFGEAGAAVFTIGMFVAIPFVMVYFIALAQRIHKRNLAVLGRFAQDNGFSLITDINWASDGAIYKVGRKHKTPYILYGSLHGYPVAIYWLTFITGSGKHQQTHQYGVVEIELPKIVPHIFLDDKRNNFLGVEMLNIFKGNHLLELEGDFAQHYKVFAAKDYETEVLTILNPGFMQALVDKVNKEEVELLDNTAFIYCDRIFGPSEENVVRLFTEADFLVTELQKQLDTFRFQVDPKRPNQIKPSWLKRFA